MIAVNVGDVIQTRTHDGIRVESVFGTGGSNPWCICLPPGIHSNKFIEVYVATVTANLTTGEGCEKSKPVCKFYHRERWQEYEREFGAETLPELYALMAAAGVKFTTVCPTATDPFAATKKLMTEAHDHETFQNVLLADMDRVLGTSPTQQKLISDAMESPHVHLPPGPIPPRTMFIPDELPDDGVDYFTLLKKWNSTTAAATGDPDQPTVVGD